MNKKQQLWKPWLEIDCSVCDLPFTEDEWNDRHDDGDGGDCHDECCPDCKEE